MAMTFTSRPERRFCRAEGPGHETRPLCEACLLPIERGEPVTVIGKWCGSVDVYHARCEWGPVAAEAVRS